MAIEAVISKWNDPTELSCVNFDVRTIRIVCVVFIDSVGRKTKNFAASILLSLAFPH